MHHYICAADIEPRRAFPDHSDGYRRICLSDRSIGAVHSGWGLCEMDAGGHLDTQSPLPPQRHSYRFARDWEYIEQQFGSEADARRR